MNARSARKLSVVASVVTAVALVAVFVAVPAGALGPYDATNGIVDSGLTPAADLPTGTGDNSFGVGTQEDDAIPTVVTGSIPNNKADLLNFWVDVKDSGGKKYLYLAWERTDDPSGSTDMDFEFNQSKILSTNLTTPVRTVNDLLITYEITNGGTAVDVNYRLWEGTQWGDPQPLTGYFEGGFNTLTDGNKTYHTFGEAAINLTDSGLFPADECVNYGSAYLKSRASPSFNSELKDFIAPVPQEIKNCGTIKIVKDSVPNDEQDFAFTTTGTGLSGFSLDDDSNAALPNTKEFVNVKPGSYTITESAVADWNLTAVGCTVTGNASATPDKDNSKASITISGDSTVECKFTNTAVPARLTVIKTVVNNDGGEADAGDFPITVTGTNVSDTSFDGAESPGVTVTLDEGSYSVTEDLTAVPGYAGTYGSGCSGSVDWGDEKTCLITNNDAPPGLTVIKHVINDDGGTKQADDFTITVTGGNPSPASFSGDEDGTAVAINAGSYSVSEGAVAGYSASYSSGCTGSISLGQSKVCTITNNDIEPRLTVIKTVINDNGGTLEAGDFTMHVSAAGPDPASFPGSATGTEVGINAGAYEVTEDEDPGYEASPGAGCEGSIDIGETKTCTIVNNDIPPRLTVTKHVVNNNGGTLAASNFAISVDAAGPTPATFNGSESGTPVTLTAGQYEVTETLVSGYTAEYSSGCEGSIDVGEAKSCLITNTDDPPALIVEKHVVNDNGGTLQADDFAITVDGDNASPAEFSGDEEGTEVALDAGGYEVTEEEDDGYEASYSSDCTGSIALGETKTCTITNDDIQPKLTVKKLVVNDNGGTKEPGDFTMEVDGESAEPASFAGSEGGTVVAVDAGSYSVGESGDEGYIATFGEGCDGRIDIGEELVCEVTNNDAPPGLTVVKNVINDNGGTATADDFTINVEGENADPGSFAGDEEGTHVDIDAGGYEVTEDEADGYEVSYSQECEGTISLGETVVCTVTNDDIPPVLTVVKNVVNDSGGTKKASDFTLAVEGEGPDPASFPGSSSGTEVTLGAGEYKVTETKVTGYTGGFSADCTGSIDIGEEKTCTVTNNDDPPVEVLGEVVTNPIVVLGIELPRTGMTYALYLAIGLFLLAAGAYLLRLSPRRQSAG